MSARDVIANLRELAALTSTADGAQRLAWGPVWREARQWFNGKLASIGLEPVIDAAGNSWATLGGDSPRTIIIGGHLDSVPNGGWLDGALGVMAAFEALRMHGGRRLPVTLTLVDWADEEGARFGRSLLGSAAAAGNLVLDEVRGLVDKQGTRLPDALARERRRSRSHGRRASRAASDRCARVSRASHRTGAGARVDEQADRRRARHVRRRTQSLRFVGQAAHSGSTPIPMRRDAFLAAAESAVAFREIARRYTTPDARVVCTVGTVKVEPGIVTAVPGVCEISLDQRALDAPVLAAMLAEARAASERAARDNNVSVEWHHIWRIEPRPFDPRLIELCAEAVREVTGDAPRLPSGPLHDAAEMVPHMPVVMMFAYSSNGLSHCKEEDTPEEHLEKTIDAFLKLVEKTVAAV